MDSVTDICKYHFLCFVIIMQVKVISGHQVKKVKHFFSWFRAAIHVLRSDFAKNAKNDPKTLFEASKSVKKQNSENHGKSRNDVKSACFDMFYAISQPFLKISTWNFVHIFMRHYPLTYVTVFWKFWFGGNMFRKEKNGTFFWKYSKIFKI